VTEVPAYRAAQVRLVGEAEVDREPPEARLAGSVFGAGLRQTVLSGAGYLPNMDVSRARTSRLCRTHQPATRAG
jgi:hypothetical protein